MSNFDSSIIGATIQAIEPLDRDGLHGLTIITDSGVFDVTAIAWSDLLSQASNGESDDLDIFVTLGIRS